GLISEERYQNFEEKKRLIKEERKRLDKTVIKAEENVQNILEEAGSSRLKDDMKAYDLLKRTEVNYELIEKMNEPKKKLNDEMKEQVEIQIKYESYIKKASEQVERMLKMEDKKIPENIDYDAISGIASEAKEKLKE